MRFNTSCKVRIKCHIKVLKHLLPNCCQEKTRSEKTRFKTYEIGCDANIYILLYK